MTGPPDSTPLSELAERDLVRRAQARDAQAFEELMRRTSSTAMRLALSIVKNREEAEDQVQWSFVKAWRRLGEFQQESKFSTWLRSIVFNQSLMHLRGKRRAPVQSLDPVGGDAQPLDPPDARATPEAALTRTQLAGLLRSEIRKLPPLFRDVLELRDLGELPIQEVAARLEVSEAAAKSRLVRARQMLRLRMERHTDQTSSPR